MKNTNIQFKIGALALIAGLYSTGVVAETASGTATATVIQPLVLAVTSPMDFGSVAAGAAASTLSVAVGGAVTETGGGDAVVINGTGSALAFTITGLSGQTYALTIDDGILDDGAGSGAPMAVTITGDDRPATLDGTAQTITVTGDLDVAAGQVAGDYSTATGGTPILITANYN